MKQGVQKFGRFLSSMVMPNIGSFIAWGIITALFIEDGWIPNEKLAELVSPMLTYLLPLLIGYTGGKIISDVRGGVVAAIATFGVIAGSDIPMLLGAMIVGPLSGIIVKKFDDATQSKIPAGFEMLVNNFSSGIIGTILLIVGYYGIGPLVTIGTNALGAGVQILVNNGLLPLTAIFVEPAKVLFLNNAINHGVFTPLGSEQVGEIGKSVFYMIESNPGPGLGLLLAFMVAGRGSARSSASGAAVIHFFGGIHELYFPYVLMKPITILALIAGGATGTFIFATFGGGLTGAASPGSIIAQMIMTPAGAHIPNILGIAASAVVTFLIAAVLIKRSSTNDDDIEAAQQKIKGMKAQSKGAQAAEAAGAAVDTAGSVTNLADATFIIFACDAGMGSSAMGATKLRKKLKDNGIDGMTVKHSPVSEIPSEAQIVVTHFQLKERAEQANASAYLVTITDFLSAPEYDELIAKIKADKNL